VFVGNLSFQTTRDELAALLSAAGTVVSIALPTDRETGRPRGFAFVEFSSEAEAAEAIRQFNQRELSGRKLNINPAEDRPRRPDGFRPFSPSAPPPSGDPFGGGGGRPSQNKPFKAKGSRRGLRARKRSL